MDLTKRSLLYLAGAAAAPLPARAAEWPTRTIRMLVGTAPGGSPDIVARILAEKLSDRLLHVPIVVENMTLGAGAVAYETTARSAPDGYTMGILTAGYPPQAALRRKSLNYDPVKGFAFVSMLCGYPMVYAVAPESPIKSFKDLIDRAKAAPGRLTYTINAPASIYDVLTKWIGIETGTSMTAVSYRGTANALTDVIAGRVDVMVDAATSAFARIRSGQLRVLALSSPERYPLMPDAPVIAETVPGVAFMSWLCLAMAPATPASIVTQMSHEIRLALLFPDVRKRLAEGGNVASWSTPEAARAKVEEDIARWSRVMAQAGIKTE